MSMDNIFFVGWDMHKYPLQSFVLVVTMLQMITAPSGHYCTIFIVWAATDKTRLIGLYL